MNRIIMTKPSVSLIGLGHMGQAIGQRIINAGYSLTVYNRTAAKAQSLIELGAKAAAGIGEAVTHADIVLSCLLDDKAALEVTTEPGGIIDNMAANAIHVSTATILPNTAAILAEKHRQHGSHYVSAAVLGVPKVALKGGLTCFCASDESLFHRYEPLLTTFSKTINYLGNNAKAPLVMKICMNTSLITALELISELYAFAEKSGLDPDMVQNGLHQIYGHPAFKLYIDKIRNRDFDDVNFNMAGGLKDVTIFQQAFTEAGVEPKIANLIKDRFTTAMDSGLHDKDWSAMSEIVRQDAELD